MAHLNPFTLEWLPPSPLVNDMCSCSVCGNSFQVATLVADTDYHNGWEMPAYTIHICSVCGDEGCIDDYYPSEDEIAKHNKEHQCIDL